MRRRLALLVVIALAISLRATVAQDKQAAKPSLENAIARSVRIARKRSEDGEHFVRATVLTCYVDDDDAYLIVCEFNSGAVSIAQAGIDRDADQCVFLEKPTLQALEEISKRGQERGQ